MKRKRIEGGRKRRKMRKGRREEGEEGEERRGWLVHVLSSLVAGHSQFIMLHNILVLL